MADIIALLKSVDASSFTTEEERKEAVVQAHALLSRTESTWETVSRLAFTIPPQMACLKTGLDIGLFQSWLKHNDGSNASVDELAELVNCDSALLARILRHLGATNMLWLNEQGLYRMTPFAVSLIREDLSCVIQFVFDIAMSACFHLPTYLKSMEYRSPTDGENTCLRHWSNQSFWEFMDTRPAVAENFNKFMRASSSKRGRLTDVYSCDDLQCAEGEVLMVDIGGGIGHDLQGFRKTYPNKAGRLLLQDQPKVIQKANSEGHLDPAIETQAYDFFTPQPVKGAQIYLLRGILHDWFDSDAKRILENLKPAMRKGYSKLLVHEVVVPEDRPDVEATSRDWVMLYLASASERTLKQWQNLLASVGFRIKKVWHDPRYAESVMETELDETLVTIQA